MSFVENLNSWLELHGFDNRFSVQDGKLLGVFGKYKVYLKQVGDHTVWDFTVVSKNAGEIDNHEMEFYEDLLWCMNQDPKEVRRIVPKLQSIQEEIATVRRQMLGLEQIEHERDAYEKLALKAMKS